MWLSYKRTDLLTDRLTDRLTDKVIHREALLLKMWLKLGSPWERWNFFITNIQPNEKGLFTEFIFIDSKEKENFH